MLHNNKSSNQRGGFDNSKKKALFAHLLFELQLVLRRQLFLRKQNHFSVRSLHDHCSKQSRVRTSSWKGLPVMGSTVTSYSGACKAQIGSENHSVTEMKTVENLQASHTTTNKAS